MDLNGSVDKNSCHEDLSLKLQSPCKIQICSMSILNSVTLPGEGRQRQGEFPETQRPDGLAYYAEEKQQRVSHKEGKGQNFRDCPLISTCELWPILISHTLHTCTSPPTHTLCTHPKINFVKKLKGGGEVAEQLRVLLFLRTGFQCRAAMSVRDLTTRNCDSWGSVAFCICGHLHALATQSPPQTQTAQHC